MYVDRLEGWLTFQSKPGTPDRLGARERGFRGLLAATRRTPGAQPPSCRGAGRSGPYRVNSPRHHASARSVATLRTSGAWRRRPLTAAGIGLVAADNAFVRIDEWPHAQALADQLSPDHLHRVLDRYARQCCLDAFEKARHWSLVRVKYSTDLISRSTATLAPL